MERRRFFRLFGAGVAGIALEQAIPFGRVWSFPSKIAVPNAILSTHWYTVEEICALNRQFVFAKLQAQVRARRFDQDFVFVEGY